ncbi:MAG TPA: DUF1697 domain-containing protein [Thermodesulfobacteriota bacterium]
MRVHIALLRGVNVGGRNQIAMSDLKAILADLGFPGARSLLQSGNLVFESDGRTGAELEGLLEAETERRLKVRADYLIRTAREWKEIVARNPFPREAEDVKALEAAIKGRETVRVAGRHAYVVYPDGIGRSKLTTALIEDRLGTRGTGRNWNTVLNLLEMTRGS